MLQDRRFNPAEGLTKMSPAANEFGGEVLRSTGGVGADLRMARERLGWTLPAVAAQLRIRLPYLEAIEDGRLGELPGNAYAVGFLRAYAGSVGLDADEIARRFRAETADLNRKTELSFPAPVPDRGVPAGAVVLVGVVVVVLAYVGWYRFSGDRTQQAEIVQPLPARLVPLDGTNVPATAVAAAVPVVTPPPPPTPVPMAMPTPAQLAATLQPTGPQGGVQIAAVASAAAADGGHLIVRAKSEAWVQVRDKTGPVVFNRTMRAGETWPVPNKSGLLLTVGNAGGTEVLLDGIATASLGADGAVRRDLPLELDQVRDGKLAAMIAVPPKPAAPKLP